MIKYMSYKCLKLGVRRRRQVVVRSFPLFLILQKSFLFVRNIAPFIFFPSHWVFRSHDRFIHLF